MLVRIALFLLLLRLYSALGLGTLFRRGYGNSNIPGRFVNGRTPKRPALYEYQIETEDEWLTVRDRGLSNNLSLSFGALNLARYSEKRRDDADYSSQTDVTQAVEMVEVLGEKYKIISQRTVTKPFRYWIRLNFDRSGTLLRYGENVKQRDLLLLRSREDNAVQFLDSQLLKEWSYQSAFFNGDTIVVQLLVHANNTDTAQTPSVRINGAAMSQRAAFESDDDEFVLQNVTESRLALRQRHSICHETDTRTPRDDLRVGRMFPVQCTAFLAQYDGNPFYLTAGHCAADDSVNVIQHRVPASYASGLVRHPPPEWQIPVKKGLRLKRSLLEEGRDFSALLVTPSYKSGVSNLSRLPPVEPFNFYSNLNAALAEYTQLYIVGHGVAVKELNQVQQSAHGPLTSYYFNSTLGLYALLYRVSNFLTCDSLGSPSSFINFANKPLLRSF